MSQKEMGVSNIPQPKADTSVLLQVSDCHLYADKQAKLLGIATFESLADVVCLAQQHTQIDAVLGTGDLTQDGSLASYQHAAQAYRRLAEPTAVRWCPGNHDDWQVAQALTVEREWFNPVLDLPHWRITLLSTKVLNAVHGELTAEQFDVLARSLAERPDAFHLVALHHHPLPVGSAWMDKIGLHQAEQLQAFLADKPQVKAVICGHVHQGLEVQQDGIRWLTSPSTCIQFLPNSDDFALDTQQPGYRWLHLQADGRVETGVERLAGDRYQPDITAGGY